MNALLLRHPTSVPRLLSWGAKICGVVLFVGWLGFVVSEIFRDGYEMPDKEAFYQGAALLAVFGGYLLCLRHALAGSIVALVATALFFVIAFVTTDVWPQVEAVWFAVPAVLTLLAWELNRYRRGKHVR